MVWWAFPIAEVVSGILSVYFFRKLYKEVVEPM
jgi:Na+-driven multidrug efflux pump